MHRILLAAAFNVALFGTTAPSAPQAGKSASSVPAKVLELNEDSYAAVRDYILPSPVELRWQQIPWRATWADALADAKKGNKPIFVWAMNGHPLGNC